MFETSYSGLPDCSFEQTGGDADGQVDQEDATTSLRSVWGEENRARNDPRLVLTSRALTLILETSAWHALMAMPFGRRPAPWHAGDTSPDSKVDVIDFNRVDHHED